MNILVDSAVYIGLLRSGQDARQALLPALRGCELYNCGVIRAEVLRGFRESKIRDVYESFFDIIPEIPTDARLWRHASQIAWELGRQGKTPPLTNIVIAACAMRIGATLISPDKHFDDIPGLKVQAELP